VVQEDVEQAIQRECEVRFSLAHSAPIMTTLLGERLCYLLDKALARSIIAGTYDIPSDMDPATKLILEEIGKLGMKIVNGEGSEIIITPEDFKQFWKKVKEFTSSSMSGVHYRHYKAAIQDALSTEILAQQLTVIARGILPENWSIGLHVMLEKIAGVCLVEKLRAIQLYKADFNCYNQFIFGGQAMQALTNSGYIPEELFSQKGNTAEDANLKRAADLSSVGWIIFCKRTGLRVTGTLWEKSPSASSFRADMLGLCCLHLLARAVADFYNTGQWYAVISCDNKRALELSSNHRRRIRPSAKCANIRRSFKSTKQVFARGFKYVHIYRHMDQYLSWERLNLMQQLNCVCDTLAKKALTKCNHNRIPQQANSTTSTQRCCTGDLGK
jgi:hypothetical protein